MESRLTPYHASPLIECTSALVFAPHPDDEALGCGGLLVALSAAGIPVQTIIVTSGGFGEHGKKGTSVREEESRAAATILGTKSLQFWRENDRGVECNEVTIAKAKQSILDANADLILTPSIHEIHPDHRATAWIIVEAARRLADEGKELKVAMFEIGAPLQRVDVLVDITANETLKRAAIACYNSQLDIQPYDEFIFSLNRYRTYTLPAEVRYAEAYTLLDSTLLRHPALLTESELHRQERLNLVTVKMPAELRKAATAKVSLRAKLFGQNK